MLVLVVLLQLLIGYDEWDSRWDEWIADDSERLAVRNSQVYGRVRSSIASSRSTTLRQMASVIAGEAATVAATAGRTAGTTSAQAQPASVSPMHALQFRS